MSIVKYVTDELPIEGSIVYANNIGSLDDRAIFKNGKFYGGDEFPMPEYLMKNVSKWFYLNEYENYCINSGKTSFVISFSVAETIPNT